MISLFEPLAFLNIRNRKRVFGRLVFGVALVLVGLAQLGSAPTP
ncbi:MAG: hypothetical protein ACM3RP_00785 [Chitinophagales bacterium]